MYNEYVENMLKSFSNSQVKFKGNVKYLLKNLCYLTSLLIILIKFNEILKMKFNKPQKVGLL